MVDTTLFGRLKRLFSTDVIIRNVGGNQLKVLDTDNIQVSGVVQTNMYPDRYQRIYTGGLGTYIGNAPYSNFTVLRPQLYNDYEAMDGDPIIASVLDIVADESSLKNGAGEVLAIKSPDENIQRILYNLFYDILNIEFNIWGWVRSMCKYGDFYLHLHIAEKYGVYQVVPLNVFNVLRLEGIDPKNPTYVRFQVEPNAAYTGVLGASDKENYFENYEIANFRLLGDYNFLPYGRCIYLYTNISTKDGVKEIQHIVKGDQVWTYNIEEAKYELANVLNVINSGVKKLYKISTRDNNIKVSDNHPMLVWDSNEGKPVYIQTKDLNIGDQLCLTGNFNNIENIEVNSIISIIEEPEGVTYDIQVDRNSNFIADGFIVHNSYIEPARKIYKQLCLLEDAMLIHRITRAPQRRVYYVDTGNLPPNEIPAFMEKLKTQTQRAPYTDPKTGEYNLRYNMMTVNEDFYIPVRGANTATKIDTLPGLEYNAIEDVIYLRDKMLAAMKVPKAFLGYEADVEGKCIDPKTLIPLLDGRTISAAKLIKEYNAGIKNYVYSLDVETKNIVPGEIEWAGLTRLNTHIVKVWLDNGEFIKCTPDHKFLSRDRDYIEAQNLLLGESLIPLSTDNIIRVIRIEWCEYLIDTCDLTIKDYHNFGTAAGVIIHNSTLAQQDIRFARTIERIQRILVSELTKIALVHLYAQGYTDENLTNFELELTTPSIIYDQERIALMKEKVDLAKNMMDVGLFPSDYIYDYLFHMSEDKFDDMRNLVIEDKKRIFRLDQIENEGNDPVLSGQSYGTPHDLASLYGRGRNGVGVPPQYDETDPVGRPQEKTSVYNTQKRILGKDPLGKEVDMQPDKGRFPAPNGGSPMAIETTKAIYTQHKKMLQEMFKKTTVFDKDSDKPSLLDESQIKDIN